MPFQVHLDTILQEAILRGVQPEPKKQCVPTEMSSTKKRIKILFRYNELPWKILTINWRGICTIKLYHKNGNEHGTAHTKTYMTDSST